MYTEVINFKFTMILIEQIQSIGNPLTNVECIQNVFTTICVSIGPMLSIYKTYFCRISGMYKPFSRISKNFHLNAKSFMIYKIFFT